MKYRLVLVWKEMLLLVLLLVYFLACLWSNFMEYSVVYALVCQLGLCFIILKAQLMAVLWFNAMKY